MTETVTIVDVTLRDGLQDEPMIVATDAKLALAEALAAAGVSRIEATSFVNPRRVPQLGDAEAVIAGLPGEIRPAALILNRRGFERAIAAFDEAGRPRDSYDLVFVVSASARHSLSNSGQTIDAALDQFIEVAALARDAGCRLAGSVSCAFGSPWEDENVSADTVTRIAVRFAEEGCAEITLCDTVGRGTPDDIAARVRAVVAATGHLPGLHLHDLAGSAVGNVKAGLAVGVRRCEGVLGGLGGCPFAPGAPGNLDLRTLVDLVSSEGFETGIQPAALNRAIAVLERALATATPLG